MRKYKEIKKLHKMLLDAGITHDFHHLYDGYQVEYPHVGDFRRLSAIEHEFSGGSMRDLIEIMGMPTNDQAVGYMTANEVFNVIKNDWNGYKESEDKQNDKYL